MFWAPVEQVRPAQTERVIISLDGQLDFISFATLLDGDKRFVVERYSIQYVGSGRDLLREVSSPSNSQVVLLANPSFDLAPRVAFISLSQDRGREIYDMTQLSFSNDIMSRQDMVPTLLAACLASPI